ncbi:MAG: UTP--glucose-1-phosphate uridylyltransferase, partial [Candidatus Margulisiibacteriota bacterium]
MSNLPDWMIRWYEDSLRLYNAPISDKSKNILPLDSSDYIDYDALPSYSELNLLCATVKLNGGLGTSMGCQGPKSLIKIDSLGNTFLDRIINQFQENDYSSDLILLNSFNTTKETNLFLNQNYSDLRWSELIQHPFKKVDLLTGAPFLDDSESSFNPPGHGSVFFDLYYSGILDDLLNRGVDYLFISNSDNLAANLDDKIMSYLQHTQCPFLIELTPKTVADVKGGTVVRSDGHLMLWEIAQVLDQQRSLFESQPVFN